MDNIHPSHCPPYGMNKEKEEAHKKEGVRHPQRQLNRQGSLLRTPPPPHPTQLNPKPSVTMFSLVRSGLSFGVMHWYNNLLTISIFIQVT